MRITRNQLTDLINEEISSALLERQNRRLLEDNSLDDMSDTQKSLDGCSLDDVMDFAIAYSELPIELRQILSRVMDGSVRGYTTEDIEDIQLAVGNYSTDLDQYLEDAHKARATRTTAPM